MNELEESKRIVKVIRELEIFKYTLIQDVNNAVLNLEKILMGKIKMSTNKKEKLEEFTKGMERILDEKAKKYGDPWTLGELREQLHKQAKSLSVLISEKIEWDHERAKRIATHIANFAYLIYNRL